MSKYTKQQLFAIRNLVLSTYLNERRYEINRYLDKLETVLEELDDPAGIWPINGYHVYVQDALKRLNYKPADE